MIFEDHPMNCHVCGTEIVKRNTGLPFKKGDNCIVIIKKVSPSAELGIVRYAV